MEKGDVQRPVERIIMRREEGGGGGGGGEVGNWSGRKTMKMPSSEHVRMLWNMSTCCVTCAHAVEHEHMLFNLQFCTGNWK